MKYVPFRHHQYIGIFKALFLLVTSPVAIGMCVAADVAVVVPNEYENVEAPSAGAIPTGPFRYQQIFSASQFPSLGEGQQIVSFAMRPDSQVTNPVSFTMFDTVVTMSTTSKEPGELSDVFSENIGMDEIVVFAGDLFLSTANSGPAEGPKDFDLVFTLQTPFSYDPTSGRNLIFDVTVSTGTDLTISQTTDFVAEAGPYFEEIAAFTPGAEVATGRWGGNVIQFSLVPEPGSLLPAFLGMMFIIGQCRARLQQGWRYTIRA